MITSGRSLIIILLLLFGGCGSTERQKAETDGSGPDSVPYGQRPIQINLPEKGSDRLNASLFADSVRYIPLETKPESILKRVWRVQMNDSVILVSDLQKLILFKRDGTFIRQIGTRGKGPGEYMYIFDFRLKKDTIYLTSSGKRSVIRYTLDGKFQGEQEVGVQLVNFQFTPEGNIAWYDHLKGKVFYFNSNLEQTDTLDLEPNRISSGGIQYTLIDGFDTYFQEAPSGLLLNTYVSDTIWDIGTGKKKAKYILNLKDRLLPRNEQYEFSDGNFGKFKMRVARYQKVNLQVTGSKIFIFQKSWVEDSLNAIFLYDRVRQDIRKYETAFVYDDITGHLHVSPEHYFHDLLIAAVNPIDLQEKLKTTPDDIKPEEKASYASWRNRMLKVKEEDNPVLVIFKPGK